jgi:hypothetical protein
MDATANRALTPAKVEPPLEAQIAGLIFRISEATIQRTGGGLDDEETLFNMATDLRERQFALQADVAALREKIDELELPF